MITVKFLSDLHRRLKLKQSEFVFEKIGPGLSFAELFRRLGDPQVDERLCKKILVSYNGKTYGLETAKENLVIKDGESVLVFFVMGGG